jgi:hypothetical protein
MSTQLKLEHKQIVVKIGGSEHKRDSVIKIGRSLTQKVVGPNNLRKLIAHEVHGVSDTIFSANDVSNRIATGIHTLKSDAHFRFIVVGRTNRLLILANLQRWFKNMVAQYQGPEDEVQPTVCRACGNQRQPTLTQRMHAERRAHDRAT